VKKLISIGVVLALLTMAVVPGAVAAQDPDLCASNYTEPCTYAKTPFAIIASGFVMLANLWPMLDSEDGLGIGMPWVEDVLEELAYWTYGPLSWTVDMLAWGVNLAGSVIAGVPMIADALPEGLDLEALFGDIACGLRECFSDVCYNVTWNCTGDTYPCCP
jgi:hypothetical protein